VTELLHIDRLSCVYKVPRDHPAPESLRSTLDNIAREQVGLACGAALGGVIDPDDPSVWVIDRLQVNVTLDAGLIDRPQVAAIWAAGITGSLARLVANGPDETAGIRRFANRAEYLAWLLGQLIAGRPWTSLHTREFEGLRSLPLSALISEALVREPAIAEAVPAVFAREGNLTGFMRSLTAQASMRILLACAPDARDTLIDKALWELMLNLSGDAMHPLQIYLLCRLAAPAVAPATVRAAAESYAQWQAALNASGVRNALAAGEFSKALKLCPVAEQRQALLLVHTLAAGDTGWIQENAKAASTKIAANADVIETSFGGVLLLLPDLIQLYPQSTALLRYVVLLKCLGRDLAPVAWQDPVLLLAAGLDELPTPEQILNCRADIPGVCEAMEDLAYFSLNRILPEPESDDSCSRAASCVMRFFAKRLMGLDRSSPAYLLRNVLSGDAIVVKSSGRIVVKLHPRPLQIVMRMAGFNGLRVTPPWLPETEVVFELPDV
jgi:hypothetical protein